jgi:hypothetical protein
MSRVNACVFLQDGGNRRIWNRVVSHLDDGEQQEKFVQQAGKHYCVALKRLDVLMECDIALGIITMSLKRGHEEHDGLTYVIALCRRLCDLLGNEDMAFQLFDDMKWVYRFDADRLIREDLQD